MKKTLIFISMALAISAHIALAATITVKQDGTGDYETIQQGIQAAQEGDTVLVWPGIYHENIFYMNKAICVASLFLTTQDEAYIDSTIIDGGQNGSCATITFIEGQGALLCGFTIQNGSGNGGGSWITGGGILMDNANAEIRNCTVQYNNANMGGGISVNESYAAIYNCIVQNNTAISAGGINSKVNATVYLSNVTIRDNIAKLSGGGISCTYESYTIFDSINRCNIYMNYSAYGSDYIKFGDNPPQQIFLDTFTVASPDQHFIYSLDDDNFPVDDLDIDILHGKIDPVQHDLYINPVTGSDTNDGLSPESPLGTIAYAYNVIASDSLDHYDIYLSDGVYSPSTNGEKFPLNGRSHVSLIGAGRDSTIFDTDSNYYFFQAYGLMEDFAIKNISFVNGYGNLAPKYLSGMYLNYCNEVVLKNLEISNCISTYNSGIYSAHCDDIIFSDILLHNNQGGANISISNGFEPPKTFKVENCTITNSGPSADSESGRGLAMSIYGRLTVPGMISGYITNMEITENLQFPDPDPFWEPGSPVGLIIGYHSKVNAINATVGNNTVRSELGYAVNVDDGSELNLYNSILFGDSLIEMALGNPYGSDYAATANISYSDLEGGENNILNWYDQHTVNWLDGNMDADPLWDTTGPVPYALPWNSPCVDAGTPMYEFGMEPPFIIQEDSVFSLVTLGYADTIPLPSTDLAGNPRIVNGRIDMGAYEFQDTATQVAQQYLQKIKGTEINVWPNPFAYNAFISFELDQKSDAMVIVYDMQGRQTKKLMDASLSPGRFSLTWDATDDYGNTVGNGAYVISLYINGNLAASEKVVKREKR